MNRHARCRVAVVTAALALAGAGCRSLDDLPPAADGSVEISLINTTHLRFGRIDYKISGDAIGEILGSISVGATGATPSALVGGLPEGDDYLLQLDATSVDGVGFCYGAASFEVVKGRSTPIVITLVCSTERKVRTKVVDGMTDYCPSLASYAASPPSAPVGGTISLTATAFSYYSDPLLFGWSASAGTLSSTMSSVATYTCTEVGTHVLTVQVTDGICPDTATLEVACFAASGG